MRIFYSIEGESVSGKRIADGRGPGEVRMCQVRLPITVPSCTCGVATLNLPTCEQLCFRANDRRVRARPSCARPERVKLQPRQAVPVWGIIRRVDRERDQAKSR